MYIVFRCVVWAWRGRGVGARGRASGPRAPGPQGRATNETLCTKGWAAPAPAARLARCLTEAIQNISFRVKR